MWFRCLKASFDVVLNSFGAGKFCFQGCVLRCVSTSIDMGKSTCLMHSVSFTPGMPIESNNHGNNVHALGDSVSFGRFTSESLAWEKWSAFSHKRYVEAAKSYAQPGSVVQKKTFFEAHCKKVAAQKAALAAALVEQEKAKSQIEETETVCDANNGAHDLEAIVLPKSHDLPTRTSNLHDLQTSVVHTNKLQPVALNLKMVVNKEQLILTQDASKEIDAVNHSSTVKLVEPQTVKTLVVADNVKDVEDNASVSVSDDSRTSQMGRPLLKSKPNTDQEVMQPRGRGPRSIAFFFMNVPCCYFSFRPYENMKA